MKYQIIYYDSNFWDLYEVTSNYKKERLLARSINGKILNKWQEYSKWRNYVPVVHESYKWITKEEAFLMLL